MNEDNKYQKALADALRVLAERDHMSTHYPECWKYHLRCAARRAADLLDPEGDNG